MQISFSLPESQFVTESQEAVTQKIRLYAALGLYQSGELSIGAASELAGLDRYACLDFCKHEGVTLHTQTPDELEVEFKSLTPGDSLYSSMEKS
jgi:predicted HTH domain antitoxin